MFSTPATTTTSNTLSALARFHNQSRSALQQRRKDAPGGNPTALTIADSAAAVRGVISEGFATTVLPHASAGAIYKAEE